MFATGESNVRKTAGSAVSAEAFRGAHAFVSSAFLNQKLEAKLLRALPEHEAPPPALPLGWEQRTHASGQLFFVDHNTCTTSWDDPRLQRAERDEVETSTGPLQLPASPTGVDSGDGDGVDDPDHAAASGLSALSLGLVLPTCEEQLRMWTRAAERNAHAGLLRELNHLRSGADVTQTPRFMLVQQIHRAIVHRFLVEPYPPVSAVVLWRARAHVIARKQPPAQLPRDALQLLTKHNAAGLTNTYRHRLGPKKLNLRKVCACIGALTRPACLAACARGRLLLSES